MVFAVTLILAFAVQVGAYVLISRKLRTRAAYRNRLASLRTTHIAPRATHAHNRPGDN